MLIIQQGAPAQTVKRNAGTSHRRPPVPRSRHILLFISYTTQNSHRTTVLAGISLVLSSPGETRR